MAGARVITYAVLMGLMVTIFALGSIAGAEGMMAPGSRIISTLYVGDAGTRSWRHLAMDPFLSLTPIPAAVGLYPKEQIRKHVRLYIPRNYESYLGGVDLLVMSDSDRSVFTSKQQVWFRDGVMDGGGSLIMAGGFESFGGAGWGNTWKGSAVEDVLPVWCLNYQAWDFHPFLARPSRDQMDNPFVTSLDWETMPPFSGMNIVTPKIGSETLLVASGPGLDINREPVLVYLEVGKGASLAHMPDWTPAWGTDIYENWEYYGDYLINMAYLVAGIPVPQQLNLVHLVRAEIASYSSMRGVAISTLEFADKFGARITPLEKRLAKVEEMKMEADLHYLEQRYENALDAMSEIASEFQAINQEAIRVKDQALFWVYVVEYVAVTGVALISGLSIWVLMIRRSIYREAGTTRLKFQH